MFRLVVLALLVSAVCSTSDWKGKVCTRTKAFYKKGQVCRYRTWLGCMAYKSILVPEYRTVYECCQGWTASEAQNCNVKVQDKRDIKSYLENLLSK